MISLLGIFLGIIFFVAAAYKRVNIVLVSIVASAIMAVFSRISVYEILMGPYMSGLSGFLNKYFLMIFLSALLGRLLNDGGGAKKIALVCGKMVEMGGKKRRKYLSILFVGILYYFMSYVGISGYVLVFTIMPIAKVLFESTDTPWRLYCFGGAQSVASTMLIGSLNQNNIFASDLCGTGTTAGARISLVATVIWWACTLVLIKIMLKDAERRGETFLTDGAAINAVMKDSSGLSMETAHRMMTLSGWTSMAPHSAGISNSSNVTKIDYSRCMKVYMIATYIPGIIVTTSITLLVMSGILH